MDLVRLSAAAGFAMMSALTIAASGAQERAEPVVVEAAPETPPEQIQSRIDDAFRASDAASAFALTGPLFPAQSGAPKLPSSAPRRQSWPADPPVDAWSGYIEEASRRFAVPADWVWGVMQIESGGRTHFRGRPITSSAGAMGLMQVMPATFAEMSALHGLGANPYDPRANILAGTAYLRAMYDRYGPSHFLAAYNAGPARVDAHLRTGRPLPDETQRYTATLIPRLVPGALPTAPVAPGQVKDLTSPEAIHALTRLPLRVSAQRRTDPAHAPVFVAVDGALPSPVPHVEPPPNDSLFVTLSRTDQRERGAAINARED